jgi:hypothetical protein
LNNLVCWTSSAPPGKDVLNAHCELAPTPFDWFRRYGAIVDAFTDDPLCFANLQPVAVASMLVAADRRSNPARLRNIRDHLLICLLSESEDPVGQQPEAVE